MKRILVAEDDRTTRTMLESVLTSAGYAVVSVADGAAALKKIREGNFDLVLTDIWMPKINGLELMGRLHAERFRPKVVVMTHDDTPATVLRAVREQAYEYVTKPLEARALVELVQDVLAAKPSEPPIQVLSARSNWVELLVPCELEVASRIVAFMDKLELDLPNEIRTQVGQAFRELLLNAVEWGGKLNPNQKVRISCLRGKRMLLYRIADPGAGFRFEGLKHAAITSPPDEPLKHVAVRNRKGLRPGGFGIAMVKAMVDELIYNEAQNEVVFVKYLDESSA